MSTRIKSNKRALEWESKGTNLMGRESSMASKDPNPVRIFNLLSTSSSSLSLSSGVPIDDELSDSPPVKNLGGPEIRKFDRSFSGDPLRKIRSSELPSSGGDAGTSMVKAGPTKTSICIHLLLTKKAETKTKQEAHEAAIESPLSSSSSLPLRLPRNGVTCHQSAHYQGERKLQRNRDKAEKKRN